MPQADAMRRPISAFRIKALLAAGLAGLALAGGVAAPAAASTDNASNSVGAPATEITVRGVVSEGVEKGCLLLNPFTTGPMGRPYLLLGGDPKVIYPGALVEVRGVVTNIATICMLGTPLKVISARPL